MCPCRALKEADANAEVWGAALSIGAVVKGHVHARQEYGVLCDLAAHPDVVGLVVPEQVARWLCNIGSAQTRSSWCHWLCVLLRGPCSRWDCGLSTGFCDGSLRPSVCRKVHLSTQRERQYRPGCWMSARLRALLTSACDPSSSLLWSNPAVPHVTRGRRRMLSLLHQRCDCACCLSPTMLANACGEKELACATAA